VNNAIIVDHAVSLRQLAALLLFRRADTCWEISDGAKRLRYAFLLRVKRMTSAARMA